MLQIKVCGLRDPENIQAVIRLKVDYIGLIFYPGSKRYVGSDFNLNQIQNRNGVKKVGVFVNAPLEEVQKIVDTLALDAVQLHGQESPEYCRDLQGKGLEIIKAFGIDAEMDWTAVQTYQGVVDYFLWDTRTAGHGGSGRRFDWQVLKGYTLDIPYFLSGGLGPGNIQEALNIQDTRLYGLDLNSKFELRPGFKDIQLLDKTLLEIRK